jgi:transposase
VRAVSVTARRYARGGHAAGHPAARGQKGAAHAYNLKSHRDQERRWVEQAEAAYARFVTGWNPRGPKARTGATKEERR